MLGLLAIIVAIAVTSSVQFWTGGIADSVVLMAALVAAARGLRLRLAGELDGEPVGLRAVPGRAGIGSVAGGL